MALGIGRQRKVINIPDENMKSVNNLKLNPTRAPTEMKRAALGELASNKMHTSSNAASNLYKSKLPVLKTGFPKTKTTVLGSSKLKLADAKENLNSFVKPEKPAVCSIIDKTKTLKLETLKKSATAQARVEISVNDKKSIRPAGVEDIDKNDHKNPFLVAAYAKDIYTYLKHLEQAHPIREDYLKSRTITGKMRSILIDWLVEVQQEYRLLQETLHIAVGILDSYLQNKPEVNRNHMQLIGVSALFLASKYEEICVPAVEELVYISASAFRENDLYEMEREMFRTIKFDLSRPISLSFLRRYSKAAGAQTIQHTFAKYFLDLSLLEYTLCHVSPSLVAAAALYLALFITTDRERIDPTLWTPTLEYYSEYKFTDLKPILRILAKITYSAKHSEFQAVYVKYSSSKFAKVSSNPDLCTDRLKMLAHSK